MNQGDFRGQYFDTSQYQGPPASNPALRYDPARARFLTASGDMITDAQTPIAEAKVGQTRAMVRLWDLEGGAVAPANPAAGWNRGQIVKGSQYVFVLTQLGPMRDPSDPAMRQKPAYWRPAL